MAKVTYTLLDGEYSSIPDNENYSASDINLIENYQVNKSFRSDRHYIETHFYSLNNSRLFSLYDYKLPGEVKIDGDGKVTSLTLNPEQLSLDNGFTAIDHQIVYHFLNDLYTNTDAKEPLFIENISQDRKELLLYTEQIDVSTLINKTEQLKENLKSKAYFEEYWLNLGENDLYIVTNVDIYELEDKFAVAIKLYEPLPKRFNVKHEAQLVEKISDSIVVEIKVEVEQEKITGPRLRGANFNIELETNNPAPTEYLSYDELFSYSNANSNREVYSYIKEQSIEINIDYSDYENFIHFSSAVERLKNFKYKVELLETYDSSKNQIQTSANNSGSISYFDNLINGVVENFDHYEKDLYFNSSSFSWPKSTTTKPHINLHSTSSESLSWYANQLQSASNYDTSNYDVLTNTLPSYIAEDTNNTNAIIFVSMIGQHFDNLWIYTKAITDKYDNDNRLEVGVSKDIVREVLTSFGTKIHNSVEGSKDLFKYLIADTYDSGSSEEVVNTFTQVPNVPADTQPIPRTDYEGELYKRIYHNLPFLLKTKGTERGLRALINCFGIPSDFLTVKQYGGADSSEGKYFAGERDKRQEDKIRIENRVSGSVGNVLSRHKSIQKSETDRTIDIHRLEVGFSPSDSINTYILANSNANFSIDNLIGDPRELYNSSYDLLDREADSKLSSTIRRFQLNDFVRVLKFYDNVLFKMIKDFVPAKSTLDTGIIIKPHLLNRSKIKSPKLSGTRPEYSASIDMVNTVGSDGGSYDTVKSQAAIQKELEAPWPSYFGGISNIVYKPDFTAPTQPNPGEIQITGTEFYHPDGTLYTFEDKFHNVWTPYEGAVSTDIDFYLMFSSESVDARFGALNIHTQHPHIVPIDYSPHGQNSWVARGNTYNVTASFTPLANDVLIAGFTLEAETDLLTRFSNYTKPLSSITPGHKTTIYKQDTPTVAGSVRKWVDDESPKLNGELSGSIIEVTDGELNRANVFKKVDIPPLNYDIVKIDQGSSATYTSFTIDKDTPAASAEIMCGLGALINDTLYHNDTGSFPATVGSFVFTDIAGQTTFAGATGDKWYKLGNQTVARISGSNGGNSGYVGEIIPCSNFDTDPPVNYRAVWNQKTINAANYQAAGFTIYNENDASTWEATASLEGTSEKVYNTGTIYHTTMSAAIDTTGLSDGTNILLDVKLTDQAGNTGNSASVFPHLDNDLTCSIKDVTTPSGYTVDFKSNFNFNSSALEYNGGTFFAQVAGIPSGEKGTIALVFSSTGGGSNLNVLRLFDNTGGSSATNNITVFTSNHSLLPGTLTVTATLTDQAGNTGATVSDSVSYVQANSAILDHSSYFNQMSVSYYAQSIQLRVRSAVPSNLAWTVTDNQSWAVCQQTSGTGNDSSVYIYVYQNYTNSSRNVQIVLASGGTNLDSFIISQAAYNSNTGGGGAGGCVAPFTKILMGDGSEKLAQHVQVGDEIRTKQELSLETTNARVNKKEITDSKRIKVILEQDEIVCSPKHRFYVDNKSDYIHADLLEEGDMLSNQKYIKTEEYGDGEVIEFSVEYAKTYISNGILSHNNKGIQ